MFQGSGNYVYTKIKFVLYLRIFINLARIIFGELVDSLHEFGWFLNQYVRKNRHFKQLSRIFVSIAAYAYSDLSQTC